MNVTPACPSTEELQEYLLGRAAGLTAEALEQHLAVCPECQKRLPSVPAEDDFVSGFRSQANRPQTSDQHLERLVERLRGLVLTLPIAQDATTPALGEPILPDPARALAPLETTQELSLSLGPPQRPDEIGRLGGYRVLRAVGRGGMGVVYQAEDIQLKRLVALKVMLPRLAADPTSRRRFLREAQAMAAGHHDHIAAIYQVGEDKGVPFMAMEFLQGTPLDKWLKQGNKPTIAQVLRIGREIAEGLAAAHERGLIHRDVKPGNIWLDSDRGDRVKILDFGLAHVGTEDMHLTHTGAVVGTPAYMAPEQARAEKVDARSDLFSLGCVLYRLCSGALPFSGDTTMSLLTALAIDRPTPPRDLNAQVPVEISDLVMSLLEKDPARRPSSAQEVVRTIRRLEGRLAGNQDSHDTAAPTPSSPPATVAARRGRPLVVAAAAALVLGGLIAGAAALIRIQTPQGDYVIDTDDPDFSFRVQEGAVQLEDHKNHKAYTLKVVKQDKDAKEVEIEVGDGGEFVFKTKTFTIKRGEKAIVTAWFEPRIGGVSSSPKAGDDWVKQIAALPAEKQVEATAAKLKELNPGFDGKMLHVTQDGVVKRLEFSTEQVTDVSPLRALIGLRVLGANLPVGSDGWTKGRLADLSPLRNLKLTALYLQGTQVSDLSALRGMRLTALNLQGTRVSDLSPLKGAPLADFNCAETAVSDLSPLESAPLTKLYLVATKISDLSPLKHMKLTRLNFGFTAVSDLSPLEGMPLTDLTFDNTAVTDLTPLKGMALKQLRCDFNPHRDAAVLRSMPTLEEINGIPAAEFWKGANGPKQ